MRKRPRFIRFLIRLVFLPGLILWELFLRLGMLVAKLRSGVSIQGRVLVLALRGYRYWSSLQPRSLEKIRKSQDALGIRIRTAPQVGFEEARVSDRPVLWAIPKESREGKVILYFHGGGYTTGSILTHRSLVSYIAKASRTRVLQRGLQARARESASRGLRGRDRRLAVLALARLRGRRHSPRRRFSGRRACDVARDFPARRGVPRKRGHSRRRTGPFRRWFRRHPACREPCRGRRRRQPAGCGATRRHRSPLSLGRPLRFQGILGAAGRDGLAPHARKPPGRREEVPRRARSELLRPARSLRVAPVRRTSRASPDAGPHRRR